MDKWLSLILPHIKILMPLILNICWRAIISNFEKRDLSKKKNLNVTKNLVSFGTLSLEDGSKYLLSL